MNIGIIIHSHTGNTNSVAEKLREKLIGNGHEVELERLRIVGGWRQGLKEIEFESLPDLAKHDALVFGAPVEGFSLSSVMKSYLKHIGSLQGKQTAFLVTQHLKHPWMGGNRAVRAMEQYCSARGAVLSGSVIVNWSHKQREQMIAEGVDRLACAFGTA